MPWMQKQRAGSLAASAMGAGKKLSAESVREIKRGTGITAWAKKFNVSLQTIKAIRRGRIWRSV